MEKQTNQEISTSSETQLTAREKGLIAESLLIVAKMQNVPVEQMQELIELYKKIQN
jgi:type III secretion system FlhB-like substrate exporter